jgi:hypothetical protein
MLTDLKSRRVYSQLPWRAFRERAAATGSANTDQRIIESGAGVQCLKVLFAPAKINLCYQIRDKNYRVGSKERD